MNTQYLKTHIQRTLLALIVTALLATTAYADTYHYGLYNGVVDEAVSTAEGYSLIVSSSESDYDVYGYGLYVDEESVLWDNSANLTVSVSYAAGTTGEYADTVAYGFYDDNGSSIANSGSISVSASGVTTTGDNNIRSYAEAVGIYASGEVSNSGAISVSALAGTGTSSDGYADGEAYAIGILVDNDGDASVSNFGNISVLADAGAADADHNAYRYAYAYGIYASGSVANYGAIVATAIGGSMTRSDDADWLSAYSYAISAAGEVTNSGTLSVTATAGSSETGDDEAEAYAYGIVSENSITNSGAINVSATGGSVEEGSSVAYAFGLYGEGDVSNTGNIIVSASGGSLGEDEDSSYAYGIYLDGSDLALTNYGSISASAGTEAYEVYISSGSSVTLVDNYTLTIDGDAATGSIYVGSSASLDLNDATLAVTTGDAFSWETDYAIFAGADESSISGSFSSVVSLNPDVSVSYSDQGTTDSSSDDTVSLTYTPQTSAALETTGVTTRTMNLVYSLISQRQLGSFFAPYLAQAKSARRMYADSGRIMSDATPVPASERQFFLLPFYAHGSNSGADFSSDIIGLVGGIQQQTGTSNYGLHFSYSRSSSEYDSGKATDIDQDTLAIGVQALHQIGNVLVRGQLSSYYAWLDYSALTGTSLELQETADYNSYGVTAQLLAGYALKRNNQVWLPEIGLDYAWLHQKDFTTNASGTSYDVNVDSIDEHQFSAVAALNWQTGIVAHDGLITPKLAAGVKYLLSDNDLSVRQSVAGSTPVTVSDDLDDLTGTLAASLQFERNRQSVELAYSGEYGEESAISSIWLRFASHF